MNFFKYVNVFVLISLLNWVGVVAKDPKIFYKNNDVQICVNGKLDTSTSCDIHANLLNNGVSNDKTLVTKTTADIVFDLKAVDVKMRFAPRSKAVWGSDKQLETKSTTIKDVDFVNLSHSHKIAPRMIWLREAWIELNLAHIFGVELTKPTFTIGAFPFSVGRGIALGDAFSVNPASLGFYSDYSVDQYAFGAKFSGATSSGFFSYDLYTAILENKSTSISETSAQTQAAAFGKKSDPSRGFGKINWIGAARAKIKPLNEQHLKLIFEPYVVHNNAPEQTVEFTADASSNLTTIGMGADLCWNRFECGFESAVNFGKQQVKGWDRNSIEKINRSGYAVFVYSNIYDANPNTATVTNANKVLYDTSNSSQVSAINNVARSTDSNGALIDGTVLYNGLSRFRGAYENKYNGFMVVGDIAYWIYQKEFKIAATGGIASGDRNPNANLADPLEPQIDGTYDGFLSLQEVYSGKQVRSAFVMGAGKLVRPLSAPNSGDQFADIVNGFNNLKFAGVGCTYISNHTSKKITINPNILAYWQHAATTKFDISTGLSSAELASKHLGIELNALVSVDLTSDLTMKASFALFEPGKHYLDIKGKPFNAAQRKALNAANKTSIPSSLPVIGTDKAYSMTWGLCYAF